MTELRGCVQDFGLATLVRATAELGRSGSLKICQAGWSGELAFDQGRVIAASIGEERGLAALELIVLALADGEFVYTDGPPVGEPNISASAAELQVELERLIGQAARRAGAPFLRALPRLAELADDGCDREVALSRSELGLLLEVDGTRSVEDLMRGHDPVRALRTLTHLTDVGVIHLEPPVDRAGRPGSALVMPRPPGPPPGAAQPTAGVPNGAVVDAVAPPPSTPPAEPPSVTRGPRQAMVSRGQARALPPGLAASAETTVSRWRLIRRVAPAAVLTAACVLGLRLVVQSVHIEGVSMLPGLQDGQLLMVNRAAYFHIEGSPLADLLPTTAQGTIRYLFGSPQRGDVVVFASPNPSDGELVKRIIGLPGESVRIDGGKVFVDDRLLDEPYTAPGSAGLDRYPADGQPIPIPDDSYFVLGDNRAVSLDSRLGWLVRVDQLIGRAWLAYWPPTAWGPLPPPQLRLQDVPPPADAPESVGATEPLPSTPPPEPTRPTPPVALAPASRTLLDGLIGDQPGWPTGPTGLARLDGTHYRLTARQPTRFVAVAAPLATTLADVTVSASFQKVGGPPGGGYGVIVRDQGPGPRDGVDQGGRFYVAEVSDRGEIGLWQRADDRWIDLLPWTPSAAVRPGSAVNELRLSAEGPRLVFVVNDVRVASLVDSTLTRGRVGVFVGGDLNDVVLDRFTVQLPPTEQPQ